MAILVAIGEEKEPDELLAVGRSLAEAYDDTLVALHVVPEDDFESYKESLILTPDFEDFSLDQGASAAGRVARQIVERAIPDIDRTQYEARGAIGRPGERILEEADRIDPRFVVIGGKRQSPIGKAIFGSTTQQVLLNANHPVVTVQQD